jgi:hypothetical protein
MTPLLGPTFQLEEMSSSHWGRSDIGRLPTVIKRRRTRLSASLQDKKRSFGPL